VSIYKAYWSTACHGYSTTVGKNFVSKVATRISSNMWSNLYWSKAEWSLFVRSTGIPPCLTRRLGCIIPFHYRELYKCPKSQQVAVDTFKRNKHIYHKIASSLIDKDLSKWLQEFTVWTCCMCCACLIVESRVIL